MDFEYIVNYCANYKYIKTYKLLKYLGALIWSTTFISLGKVLGDNYDKFNNNITKCVVIGIIGVLLILLIVYLIKRYKN